MEGLISIRFLFACMAFLGIATVQMMRFNISVAMAIMAGSGHLNSSDLLLSQTPMNGSYLAKFDNALMKMHDWNISENTDSKEIDKEETEFNWSSHTQGLLLAAFFIGYTLGNIPAGWLADKLGGKWIIFGGACGSAILNALGPLAARSSVGLFFATRFLAGISEGFILPAVNTMVNNWSPVNERTRMMTFIVAGFAFGPAIGQSLSGIICAKLGWPASFYFFGGLNITWAFFWAVTSYEDPSQHPFITRKELVYIETTRSKKSDNKKVPIRSILLSLPFIAFTVVFFGTGFVYFSLACNLPIYFKHVLGFDILSVGFLTSIPYVCQWIISLLASSIADALIGRNILSRTSVRKFTICSGALIMAACFFDDLFRRAKEHVFHRYTYECDVWSNGLGVFSCLR
ncbi:sialin isoform X1 [Strongylocentrotus purpuratus]|uniref:Major facilitator superfamily (MFS) profile domain-containing protein n=1 Tax=Strongylocentrotus purpuratus TaxID=7668 RepID=A0A7M7PG52_STRPU|nr:sialin isoform X1 [Strongylocentrotus purpuratus]